MSRDVFAAGVGMMLSSNRAPASPTRRWRRRPRARATGLRGQRTTEIVKDQIARKLFAWKPLEKPSP
jgi:hypothetical protein